MTRQFTIDPEVRQLLGEIARRGGDLLRVAPESIGRTVFALDPRVSSAAAFLERAERRLLEVHREEVAQILHLFGHVLRTRQGSMRARYHFRDETVEASTWEALGRRAEHALDAKEDGKLDGEIVGLLLDLTGERGAPTAAQVMAAELRLIPSNNARIALAADLHAEGRSRESATLLEAVLQHASQEARSYVHENRGLQYSQQQDYTRAAEEYKAAACAESSRVMPLLAWLGAAVQAGLESAALEASERVEATVDATGRALLWYANAQAVLRKNKAWTPSTEALKLVGAHDDSTGPSVRKVLDGFK